MEHKTCKYLIAIGFFIGFILFLCAPVFAFEGFEVTGIPFTYIKSTDTYQEFSDKDYPDSAFYSIPGFDSEEVGIQSSFPVPYYADGDHYSVFMNFSFLVPYQAYTNNQWVGIYIRPMVSSVTMHNSSSGQWLKVNMQTPDPTGYSGNSELTYGTIRWQGHADCSYRMLVTCMNDAFISGNQPRIYNVSLVLDLNLTPGTGIIGDELRPFSVSARYYLGYPNISSGYGLALYKDYSIRCTDTSIMGVLENIQTAISDLDFSGLSGLADMSATVTNLYNSYVTNSGIEIGLMESIIDDGETDAEPIQWESQAQEMQSQVEELHSLEEDIKGTFTEYEFPTAPNQSAIGNVANMFFQNELFIALTLAFFTMTLCMMFLF